MPTPAAVRARLLVERERAERRLGELDAGHDRLVEAGWAANVDDEHDPEGATTAFERAQLDTVREQVRHSLTEIGAALHRLEEGGYGRCERCGGTIPPERLEVRPTARTCVGCA